MSLRTGNVLNPAFLFLMALTVTLVTASLATSFNSLTIWAYPYPSPYSPSDDPTATQFIPIKQKVKDEINCEPGIGKLKKGVDIEDICNPGLEKMKSKLDSESEKDKKGKSEDKNAKLQNKIEKKEAKLKERLERLERILAEEENQKPISDKEQKNVQNEDKKNIEDHKTETDEQCRDGNVLDGASNDEDLKLLRECEEAEGEVMHTKNMDDGDYKFLLKLDEKYEFLLNDKNEEKTDGFLVVEIVPKDRDSTLLPDTGDKVHIFGAWVTDEPKGWHEIHPAWSIEKQ